MTSAPADYARRRDQLCPDPATTRFFVSAVGTPVLERRAEQAFAQLTAGLGLRTAGPGPTTQRYLTHFAAGRGDRERAGLP